MMAIYRLLEDLPLEIFEWILNYIHDPADLVSLHRSCSFCYYAVDGALPRWLQNQPLWYEVWLETTEDVCFFARRCEGMGTFFSMVSVVP